MNSGRAVSSARATMDVSDILHGLNEAQRDAVAAERGNLLVLAGAGSGKTRVLVHRIAWLIRAEGLSPHGLLAVTFTNKAAREMRGRIEHMLQIPTHGMWVGTFHGLAHRLLKTHWREARLPQNFQILDSDDQLRLVKRVCRELQLDESRWPPKQAQWYINAQKDEGLRAHISKRPSAISTSRPCCDLYGLRRGLRARRPRRLRRAACCAPTSSGSRTRSVLAHYQGRFKQVLVDEFQDTNTIQYAWLRVLAGSVIPVVAVGDDDQSIYGWRGAKIENIQRFGEDFAGTSRRTPGAELPLDADHPARRQRGHRPQRRPPRQGALDRRRQRRARTAVRRLQRAGRGALHRRAARGWTRDGHPGAPWPSSIAPTPSPGCSRRRCCAPTCPTASTAASASTSVSRSAMPWPTCACWSAAATTQPWSG
jgi:hypothetical protein